MNSVDFVSRLLVLPALFVIDPLAPLVVLAWALRLGLVTDPYFLQPDFAGFAGDGFLAIATTAYVLHMLADKVPLLAHLMDGLGIILKPLALAFAGLWLANRVDSHTMHWATLAVILIGGVPATFSLQTLRTKVRLGASAASFGAAHPAISTAESLGGITLSYLMVMHPVAAAMIVLVVGVPLVWICALAVRTAGRAAAHGIRRLRGNS